MIMDPNSLLVDQAASVVQGINGRKETSNLQRASIKIRKDP